MRAVTAILVAMMACVVLAQFDAISLPPPPASEFDVEGSSLIEAQQQAQWDGVPELEDWEGRSRNTALAESKAKKAGSGAAGGAGKNDLSAFDSIDWTKIPTDKQLPGDVVRLRHAPGAVPPLNEEVLPKTLLPPAGCTDANQINDVKLWNTLTTKLKGAKVTGDKYKKWLKGAEMALKKVKAQVKLTKTNHGLILKAIKGMTHQRRQIVKRLKATKLKADLKAAQAKMKKLNAYGKVLGRTQSSLVEGHNSMNRRVKLIKRSMTDLRTFGKDA